MHGRAGFALLRKRVLLAANPQAITFRNPITKSAPEPDNVSTTEQIPPRQLRRRHPKAGLR